MKKLVFVLLLLFQAIVGYSQWIHITPKDEFGEIDENSPTYVYEDEGNKSLLFYDRIILDGIVYHRLEFCGENTDCSEFYNLRYNIKGVEGYNFVRVEQRKCRSAVLYKGGEFTDKDFSVIIRVLSNGKFVAFRWGNDNNFIYKGEPIPNL
jgi:hypothetical protein